MVPLVAAVLLAGCATTKLVDWNSRIGAYTFDQAITELRPPTNRPGSVTAKRWPNGSPAGVAVAAVSIGMGAARQAMPALAQAAAVGRELQ